jgi:hypothetical protein
MASKELPTSFLTFFGKHNRLRLPNWVKDHPFLVQSPKGTPIMSLPCSSMVVVKRKKEQRENGVVDFVFVVIHTTILLVCGSNFNRAGGAT